MLRYRWGVPPKGADYVREDKRECSSPKPVYRKRQHRQSSPFLGGAGWLLADGLRRPLCLTSTAFLFTV